MYEFLVLAGDVAVVEAQNLWDRDATAEVLGDSEVEFGWIRVGEIVEAQRRLKPLSFVETGLILIR